MRSLRGLAGQLSKFEQRSLLALLWAAAESPGTRRSLPTITTALTATLRFGTRRSNSRKATPTDLADVLASTRDAQPAAARLEDFEPADPRLVVHWAVGSQRLRVDPGLVEDPTRLLADLQFLSILDDDIVKVFGFGITDLQEVALRCADRRLSQLEGLWAHPQEAWVGAGSPSPGEEVLCRRRYPGSALAEAEVKRVVRSCTRPAQAARALDFASVDCSDLSLDLRPMMPFWGPVLAVHAEGKRTLVPSSLLLRGPRCRGRACPCSYGPTVALSRAANRPCSCTCGRGGATARY